MINLHERVNTANYASLLKFQMRLNLISELFYKSIIKVESVMWPHSTDIWCCVTWSIRNASLKKNACSSCSRFGRVKGEFSYSNHRKVSQHFWQPIYRPRIKRDKFVFAKDVPFLDVECWTDVIAIRFCIAGLRFQSSVQTKESSDRSRCMFL